MLVRTKRSSEFKLMWLLEGLVEMTILEVDSNSETLQLQGYHVTV